MTGERQSKVLSTRIPADLYDRLRVFAGLHMVSMNSVIVDALGAYLAKRATDKEIDAMVARIKEKFGTD